MSYSQVFLEVYCGYKNKIDCSIPNFCKKGVSNPGFHCFENECSFISYAECPNEFAYIGEYSEVKDSESSIGFGGEMEPNNFNENERKKLLSLWEQICKRKIKEAYGEYMKIKNNM